MYIQKITLENFGSYHGTAIFDFDNDTGQNGYAIFGEIGRGKTTLVDAVLWCLYGHVEVTKEIEGKILKKNRPMVDSKQMSGEYTKKWYLPLLNFQAWYDEIYKFSVRLEFTHNGRNYSLLREVSTPLNYQPRVDADVKHQPHLTVDGKTVNANLISASISEIIPERIAKFFFVEVDSIKSYSTLLDSDGSVGGIVDDVEAILGMPALDHSKTDFSALKKVSERAHEKLVSGTKRNKAVYEELKFYDEQINALTTGLNENEHRIKEIGDKIEKIDEELAENTSTETHMQRLKDAQKTKGELKNKMDGLYQNRQTILSSNAWKVLLQGKISNISERLEDKHERKIEIDRKVAGLIVKRDHLVKEINTGGATCEACGYETDGITVEGKLEKGKEVGILESKIEDLNNDSKLLGDPSRDLFALSGFRDSSTISIKDIEKQLGIAEMDISVQNKNIAEIQKALTEHDVLAIQNLQSKKTKLIEERGDQKGIVRHNKRELEELRDKRARKKGDLQPDSVDSPQEKMFGLSTSIYDWMAKLFETSLSKFKQDARKSVEDYATLAWKHMIPEPEKYKKITINSTWNTEVISSKGKPLPITNPGHRQTLAVCLFDGLRKTSKRRFPTFFDNPGSNIGEFTLNKMASHFWNDADDQIVMLSHGGGLKRSETMKSYGSKLARAWELSYVKDETTTQVEVITS